MPREEVKKKAESLKLVCSHGYLSSFPVPSLPRSGRATCPDLIQRARGPLPRPAMDIQAVSTLMAVVLLMLLGLSCKPSQPVPLSVGSHETKFFLVLEKVLLQ